MPSQQLVIVVLESRVVEVEWAKFTCDFLGDRTFFFFFLNATFNELKLSPSSR